ncbi:hypothetical protein [Tissierella praeacuta]|uniref:hypothetical protein n=1 Tax=Tissierella praeacuta TaxID=43131 RepID=UPI00333EC71C
MRLELKQIFMPNLNPNNEYTNYEKKLQPHMKFEPLELNELYEKHKDEIMEIVTKEITEYLEDEGACNDDEYMFPRRCEMTGEWYIGDIRLYEENGRIWGGVFIRFLGYYPAPTVRMPIDDYLGLDVWVAYDQEQGKFVFDDGLDSSSI